MSKKYSNLLTLALTGRNDDYNPFFVNRLKYCLEYASYCLNKTNIKNFLRFSISDWGSKVNLKNILNLNKRTSSIVDFHEVDESLVSKIGDSSNRNFSTAIAHNIAVKKSNSKFIGYTSHDYIMNESFIENLYNYLSKKTFKNLKNENNIIIIPRKHLPESLFIKKPSFTYLSRWLLRSGEVIGEQGSKHGGEGGAYIMSKEVWSKLGGIDNRFSGWGVLEYDLFLRANYFGNWYDSSKFGVWQYKLPRGNSVTRSRALKNNLNKNWFSLKPNPNGNSWGLSKVKSKKYNQLIYLQKENRNFDLIINPINSYKKISLFNLFSIIKKIFNVPVQIRFKFIRLNDIRIILILKKIFSFSNIKSVNFFGYSNCFIPGFLSIFSPSAELHVIDDLKKTLKTSSKLNDSILGDNVYKRLILLSSFLREVKHLGYFRPITGDLNNNLEIFFKDFPKEKFSNLLIFKNEILNKNILNKLYKLIKINIENIDIIIFEQFDNIKYINIKFLNSNFHIKKYYGNIILFNKKKYKSKNNSISEITNTNNDLILFFSANVIYYLTLFKRIILNRILKKLI